MQPLDDLVPDEKDAQSEKMIDLVRQSYDIVEVAADPTPQQRVQALTAVRQRLLEAQQARLVEQTEQPVLHVLAPARVTPAPVAPAGFDTGNPRLSWKRRMALFAAFLCVALLVGSMLVVFGLLKRGTSTQVATDPGARALYIVTNGWLQKIDAKSGASIWQVPLPYQKGNVTPPINFPLVGNGAVYVTEGDNLLAFNAISGRKLWRVKLDADSTNSGGPAMQPVFAQGRLYYTFQAYPHNSNRASMILEVFDSSSGHVLWQYHPTEMSYIDRIVVEQETVYVSFETFSNGELRDLAALNVVNGSQKWITGTAAGLVPLANEFNADSTMVVKDGIIYQLLSSSLCGVKDGICLFAYRKDNGTLLWHSQSIGFSSFAHKRDILWFKSSLVAGAKALYIDTIDGIYALNASNGQMLWKQPDGNVLLPVPANPPAQFFAGTGNPHNAFVVVGDTIFRMEMTSQGNYLAQLNINNGKVMRRQHIEDFSYPLAQMMHVNSTGQTQLVEMPLFEGLMSDTLSYVFRSPGHLDALDDQTGERLWSIQLVSAGPRVLITLAA